MASTYPLHYTFTRCTDNGSSDTYTNDFVTYSMFKAKAVDGCFFQENDGDNCFFVYNGGTRFDLNFSKVSPSDDQKVINGELTGITSDGKYCCRRVRLDSNISGDIYVTLNATGGTPVVPVSVTNNVAHTTYKTEVQGRNMKITLTCDNGYAFDGVPTVTYGGDPEDPFVEAETADMTVSGNVATFTLATASYGGFATLSGNTKEVIPEPHNNISGTTYTAEEDPFAETTTVTITCNDGLVFDGVPTVTYVNTSGQKTFVPTTVNETNTVATAEISALKYIVSLDGNTKPKPVEPTGPTITNSVPDSTESHTVDGSSVTVNLTSKKVMLNVSCAYYDTSGISKNVPVTVNVVVDDVKDTDNVTSNASFTLPDVDFNSPVVISGESKRLCVSTTTCQVANLLHGLHTVSLANRLRLR